MRWAGVGWRGVGWRGGEWRGVAEWGGGEGSRGIGEARRGVEWGGAEWSGVEWSGVEWSGLEWRRVMRGQGRPGAAKTSKNKTRPVKPRLEEIIKRETRTVELSLVKSVQTKADTRYISRCSSTARSGVIREKGEVASSRGSGVEWSGVEWSRVE